MVLPLSLRGEHWLCRVIRDPGSKITGIGRQNRANIPEKMPTGDLIGQLQVKRKLTKFVVVDFTQMKMNLRLKGKLDD